MRVRTTFLSHNSTHFTGLALPVILVALLSLTACAANGQPNLKSSTTDATQLPGTATGNAGRSIKTATHTNIPPAASSDIQHYEYVFPDGGMYVYDIDHGHMLVKSITDLPTTTGVRGVAVSPATHMLYISYGGDGGPHDKGFLLKYDLITDQLVWTKTYTHGIDSMAISPDGKTIYMPDGELSADGIWYVIDANSGDETGSINGALGPHNTILSLNGAHVYLGGRNYNYLEVADTANNQVIKSIGPLLSSVRPFTINETETIAYMSTTGFLGFQVGDITTGKILYTVP